MRWTSSSRRGMSPCRRRGRSCSGSTRAASARCPRPAPPARGRRTSWGCSSRRGGCSGARLRSREVTPCRRASLRAGSPRTWEPAPSCCAGRSRRPWGCFSVPRERRAATARRRCCSRSIEILRRRWRAGGSSPGTRGRAMPRSSSGVTRCAASSGIWASAICCGRCSGRATRGPSSMLPSPAPSGRETPSSRSSPLSSVRAPTCGAVPRPGPRCGRLAPRSSHARLTPTISTGSPG